MNSKSMMSFAKGMGAGMVVAGAAVVVGKVMMNNSKSLAKGSTKAIKAVSDFVDGVQTIFH